MDHAGVLASLMVAALLLLLFGPQLYAFYTSVVEAVKSGDWDSVTSQLKEFADKLTEWFKGLVDTFSFVYGYSY